MTSENFQKLDELIPKYALNKKELDGYKKLCDEENAEIKSIMNDLVLSHYETEDYKAVRTTQHRTKINEDVLLSLFTSVPAFVAIADEYKIVKTKPFIDFDALENAIYKDGFSQEQLSELNKATEDKEVIVLKVTKKKGKKNVR